VSVATAEDVGRAGPAPGRPKRRSSALTWQRIRRNRVALLALGLFVAIVLACLVGGPLWVHFVTHQGPDVQNLSGTVSVGGHQVPVVADDGTPIGPGWRTAYLLGADANGRDLFVRLLYGGRISLLVGVASALITCFLALLLGVLAGYYRGYTDGVISRLLDLIWSFPVYLLAVALATSLAVQGMKLGPIRLSAQSLVIPILVIGVVISLSEMEFTEAAVATGMRPLRIMVSELVPNVASIMLVMFTLVVANNILTEAALSYLGVGVPVLIPSWGNILEAGLSSIVTAPWLTIGPGVAIMLTVVSLNMLGDALRDALDPHGATRTRGF
jgi:peptide/nickel transport system permease protein